MKSMIHNLTLASVLAAASSIGAFAQDEPTAEPAQTPPVVESPAPQPVETSPPPAAVVPAKPAEVSQRARPAGSPQTGSNQRGDRQARDNSIPDGRRDGNRGTLNVGEDAPVAVAQSGRSGRGPDRPSSGGSPQRDGGRRDDGRRDGGQRSQLGIRIGPGGVQVFRGSPGISPGYGGSSRNYNGLNRSFGPGYGYSSPFYQNRGWGASRSTLARRWLFLRARSS
ncbi:MAG: hypothetical protein O2983_10100 [Planctomycetota bacterium]|nr:hypothetical protein [Planctomycetota bacterium]MDA0918050.1 hypothetical protein [Planctomycetota bacterium]MDA1159952.1 hypothetical protein [Planctomycetota bacterium]